MIFPSNYLHLPLFASELHDAESKAHKHILNIYKNELQITKCIDLDSCFSLVCLFCPSLFPSFFPPDDLPARLIQGGSYSEWNYAAAFITRMRERGRGVGGEVEGWIRWRKVRGGGVVHYGGPALAVLSFCCMLLQPSGRQPIGGGRFSATPVQCVSACTYTYTRTYTLHHCSNGLLYLYTSSIWNVWTHTHTHTK